MTAPTKAELAFEAALKQAEEDYKMQKPAPPPAGSMGRLPCGHLAMPTVPEGVCLVCSGKPPPAGDDLVRRLRGLHDPDDPDLGPDAAARIDALQAAQWQTCSDAKEASEGCYRAVKAERERDALQARVDEQKKLLQSAYDAEFAASARAERIERETIERCAAECQEYADAVEGDKRIGALDCVNYVRALASAPKE